MSLNKLKHVVVLSDSAWETFTQPVAGYTMIGTLSRGSHTGALAMRDGRYYCVTGGNCEPLNERKIALGIAHAGVAE